VAVVIARLMQLSMGEGDCFPFTVELDDPSGNSFVENYCAPKTDPKLLVNSCIFQREILSMDLLVWIRTPLFTTREVLVLPSGRKRAENHTYIFSGSRHTALLFTSPRTRFFPRHMAL